MHEEGAPFHCVSALNSSLYLHAVLSDAQGAHAHTHEIHLFCSITGGVSLTILLDKAILFSRSLVTGLVLNNNNNNFIYTFFYIQYVRAFNCKMPHISQSLNGHGTISRTLTRPTLSSYNHHERDHLYWPS